MYSCVLILRVHKKFMLFLLRNKMHEKAHQFVLLEGVLFVFHKSHVFSARCIVYEKKILFS